MPTAPSSTAISAISRRTPSLATEAMLDFLNRERDSKTFVADPTGNANLAAAWQIGAMLRKLPRAEADRIARDVGSELKSSLHRRREADLAPALLAAS